MLKMESGTALVYGLAVFGSDWMDDKRIQDAKITKREVFKKFSTYTYLGIGLFATLNSALGWWRRFDRYTDPVAHGFLYDLPRFGYNLVKAFQQPAGTQSRDAIAQANEIIARANARALAAGRPTDRSYQPEFAKAMVL